MTCIHQNNLVDSLEFLSSFALLSGMTPEEKISCEAFILLLFVNVCLY